MEIEATDIPCHNPDTPRGVRWAGTLDCQPRPCYDLALFIIHKGARSCGRCCIGVGIRSSFLSFRPTGLSANKLFRGGNERPGIRGHQLPARQWVDNIEYTVETDVKFSNGKLLCKEEAVLAANGTIHARALPDSPSSSPHKTFA